MGFMDFEFPNVDYYKHDLRELIALVKELAKEVETVGEGILEQANAYTDEQLAGYQAQIEQLKIDVDAEVLDLQHAFDDLKTAVNISLGIVNDRIDDLHDELEADINAVNQRTDLAIQQNNAYLLEEMQRYLSQIEVLNYFTGEYITVQAMFDFLCTLHAEDGILVNDLVSRQKTVNTLVALNMTMSQLAMYGASVIPQ